MNRLLLAAAALIVPAASIWADDKVATPGNPPVVVLASGIDAAGSLTFVEYRTIFIQPADPSGRGAFSYNVRSEEAIALKEVQITTADGKEVTVEAARKRLAGTETAVLVAAWGEKLPAAYRPLFKDDVLLFTFPKDAPAWRKIQEPSRPLRK